MKTFLKVLLLVLAAIVAIKLLPLAFALGWVLAAAGIGLIALGVSVAAAIFGVVVVLAAVLSPIWLPVLAVVGLIALLKRGNRRSGAGAAV